MSVIILPQDPRFAAIGFEVYVSSAYTMNTTATTNPVEGPTPITDHLRNDPEAFECEVLCTNTLFQPDFYGSGIRASESILPYGRPPVRVDAFRTSASLEGAIVKDLIAENLERLERFRDARILCDVVTQHKILESMVMIVATLGKGAAQAGLGTFRLGFQKVKIVGSATVSEPQPKEPRGKPGANKGKAPSKEPDMVDQIEAQLQKAKDRLSAPGGKSLLFEGLFQ
jgi:hypothetical protein